MSGIFQDVNVVILTQWDVILVIYRLATLVEVDTSMGRLRTIDLLHFLLEASSCLRVGHSIFCQLAKATTDSTMLGNTNENVQFSWTDCQKSAKNLQPIAKALDRP